MELVRKFAVTAVLFFFAPGTILQIIMAMLTAILFLSIHSYVGPYKSDSDTSLAAYAHMQLTLTLFCGLLIKANVPWFYRTPNYQAEQEDIIAWVIILAHASMMTYVGAVSTFAGASVPPYLYFVFPYFILPLLRHVLYALLQLAPLLVQLWGPDVCAGSLPPCGEVETAAGCQEGPQGQYGAYERRGKQEQGGAGCSSGAGGPCV